MFVFIFYISDTPPPDLAIQHAQLLVSGAAFRRQVKVVVNASLQLSNGIIKFISASVTFRLYIN